MASIVKNLQALGCVAVIPFVQLFWRYPDRYLPYYLWDLPSRALQSKDRISGAFRLFEDAVSLTHFVQQLRLRLHSDFSALSTPGTHEQYFPPFFRPIPDERFVDCGAFDGDSIRDFLDWNGGSFSKIVAFEPDLSNADRLRQFVGADLATRLDVRAFAIGDRSGSRRFAALGAGSSALTEDGESEVQCTTLDDAFCAQRTTFIKMDIEGEETCREVCRLSFYGKATRPRPRRARPVAECFIRSTKSDKRRT